MLFFHLILIIVLSFVLGRAASVIGESVSGIGKKLRVSGFLLAFVVLGLATSLPEISVAVFSARSGVPGLSLGNLIGANIVILSLLIGLAAVLAGRLPIRLFTKSRSFTSFLFIIGAPALVVLDGRVSRVDGLFLIALYILMLLRLRGTFEGRAPLHTNDPAQERGLAMLVLHGALATAVILGASYLLIKSAIVVATILGIAPVVIGLLMLSIGTNLPELTLTLTQSRGSRREVMLGDLLGSVVVNTPTLGLLGVMSPFTIADPARIIAAAVLLLLLLGVFGYFAWTRHEINKREGAVLIGFYALFILYELAVAH